jgi:hypothetical protein
MRLENPKNIGRKEQKRIFGLFIMDVKQFLQKLVEQAMVHFLNNVQNLTSSSLILLMVPKG